MKLVSEWQPQSAVMLTWPHRHSDWAPYLADAERTCLAMAAAVVQRQKLVVICYDQDHLQHVQGILRETPASQNIHYAVSPGNDTWIRDYGPLSLRDDHGNIRLLDFRFNAWGGKFDAELDDGINAHLQQEGLFGLTPLLRSELILEGGSVEVNDAGEMLTTAKCLLAPTRNPQLSRSDIESELKQSLGLRTIHWLSEGEVEGDDTDAHIDTLARFTDDSTIVHISCDDPGDPHHAPLTAMREQLAALRDQNGRPYRLLPLPIPKPIHFDGRRLPATHANFLIINDAVLLPVYNDPTDDIARETLQACFPGRDIVAIDCLPLIRQSGSLHCMTMQLAAGVDLRHIINPQQ